MELKNIINSAISLFLSGFLLFYIEPMMALGDWKWLVLAGICVLILFLVNRKEVLTSIRRARSRRRNALPDVIDYIDAVGIIETYIHPSLTDVRSDVQLAIVRDFMDRFENQTGAKLGEFQYNGKLLHQWLRSNAAKLLVANRSEL